MLCSLAIRNFILIDELELDFKRGFTAITGETGAGKSIILDAILFAFGQKLNRDVIKYGCKKASVVVACDPNPLISSYLTKHEIDFERNEQVLVRRVISDNCKSKHYINDQMVAKKILADLMGLVIEMHGQHTHTALLDSSSHLEILDEFAANISLREQVASAYCELTKISKMLERIKKERESIESEIDYLEHVCNELEEAAIEVGEAERLQEIRTTLQNKEKEIGIVQDIVSSLETSEFGNIIARAQKSIARSTIADRYHEIDGHLETIYDHLEEVRTKLDIIGYELQDQNHSFEEIDDRLHLIKELARKHKIQPDELPKFLSESKSKLNSLGEMIADSSDLASRFEEAKKLYFAKAQILSESRKKSAAVLQDKVANELAALDMKKAIFIIQNEPIEDQISQQGIDDVLFCASTNPGTQAGAINKIASGGELSRLMLALKAALFIENRKDAVSRTIIFDEIDVGISGRVAESIGQKLKSMSSDAQVITITHQPQVAGQADNHILVIKEQHETDTQVIVAEIEGAARSREIARMISGKEITETGIKAAKELINTSLGQENL